MENMVSLADIVRHEVEDYARGITFKAETYAFSDDANQRYVVIVVPHTPRQLDNRHAVVLVMARVEGDQVIIEEDINDRPLAAELIRAGVPEENIVYAYDDLIMPDLATLRQQWETRDATR